MLPLKTDPLRPRLELMLEDNGLADINVVAETNSVAFVMSYARESDAIGFFPRAMVEYGGGDSGLCFLDLPALSWQRQFNIVRRQGTSLSPAAQLLIRELRAETESR
jgi:DNA-binding transcriptional LysR family regulator